MNTLRTPSAGEAKLTLVVLAVIALAGLAVGWDKGQLPRRDAAAALPGVDSGKDVLSQDSTAPDLQLYREIIAEVRGGRGYYDVAREKIPQFGFPISSPLNWRLPTYAWLLSLLPNKCWIQGVLLLLGIGSLVLTFHAERSRSSIGHAAAVTFLMFGVMRWVLDGEAYLAQEVWAGILITISIAAHALGGESFKWRLLAIAAGTLALLFRELALPYCLVAGGLALWNRKWLEAALWSFGILAFVGLLGWHVMQVQAQLGTADQTPGAGLAQWLRFGGLDFVLLTLRMNSLLFALPAALRWMYLLASLVGLARRTDDTSRLCCLAALLYVLAYAVVGRPENFYWGLMAAPLLPWGIVHAPRALGEAWTAAGGSTHWLQRIQSKHGPAISQ